MPRPRPLVRLRAHWATSPTALAGLFLFTVSPRALLLSLIPLEALARLGDAGRVSVLFLVASGFGMAGSLCLPAIVRRAGARGAFHVAALGALAASALLPQTPIALFLAGMVAWAFSTVAFEVSMNLYVMHRIGRHSLSRFEPQRILFAVVGYSLGPWLGVYLAREVAGWAPYVLASAASLVAVGYFHSLGLGETRGKAALGISVNPLRHVARFFAQPRLRLAWFLTLARAAWWATFFIYTPLYAVRLGLSESEGGALVSLGVATVYSVLLWGWVGRRYGFRRLCIGGFGAAGVLSLTVPLAHGWTGGLVPLAAGLLLASALCAAVLDGVGHIAYLRAVRPRERETMSGVYTTYRDAAQLLPPGLFVLVLLVAPLPAVFAVSGTWMLVMAWYCRYLPRRLR